MDPKEMREEEGHFGGLHSGSGISYHGSLKTKYEAFILKGGQLVRAAGAVAKLIAKEGKSATLRLPSGEQQSNKWVMSGANQKSLGRAESKCWLGKRPVTIPMEVVKGGPRLVEKNPQLLGVIPRLEEGVGKGINIVIFLFFVAINRKRKTK
ncbi:50S ribosomal protein L2 [Nymphaea thermarum]|nr:50S ribosomal protein L2 [Nymphaea thermarum]